MKIALAIILAVLSALLLAGASNSLFTEESDGMPIPMPEPNRTYQLLWSLQWLGIALLVSLLIVTAILLVGKIRPKKSE